MTHGRQKKKSESMEKWNAAWKGGSCVCGMFYLPHRAQFKDKEQVTPSVEMYNFSSSKKHFFNFFFFFTSVLPCSRDRRKMQWKSAGSYAYSGGCPNKRQQGAGKMTQSATSCLEYLDRSMFYLPDPHKKLSMVSRVCDPGTGEAESGRSPV